eukprot:scaffold221092_cov33-Prasinocladus_malaysianus.AAC.1
MEQSVRQEALADHAKKNNAITTRVAYGHSLFQSPGVIQLPPRMKTRRRLTWKTRPDFRESSRSDHTCHIARTFALKSMKKSGMLGMCASLEPQTSYCQRWNTQGLSLDLLAWPRESLAGQVDFRVLISAT